MCFRYREKRYGKLSLILFSILVIALGVAAVYGGIFVYNLIPHWSKYLVIVLAIILGLFLVILGAVMFGVALGMSGRNKSVRDVNSTKGTKYDRLCEFCGRVISKKANFCEHCGKKLNEGTGIKICPDCKTKNKSSAKFCEKCGKIF